MDAALPTDAWDDIYVGKDLGRRDVEVTPDLIERFAAACDDDNPWYTGDSPFGGAVAPALIACQEPWRCAGWYPAEIIGNLHAKQEWDLFAPVMAGSTYTAAALIVDRYPWKANRHVIVNEVTVSDAAGKVLARGRTHQSFLLPEGTRVEGYVVDRDKEKSPDRRIEVGSGDGDGGSQVDGPSLELAPGRCLAIADGLQNYHSDEEMAKSIGFPTVVVQGVFNMNAVSALMTQRFGAGWFCGGKMRVSLTNPIWGGDTATAHVAMGRTSPESPRARTECHVWVDKADGTVTAIGTASAIVAS